MFKGDNSFTYTTK